MNPAPSMDSAGSEIRLYGLSGGALVEVARLSALAPPRAVEGDLRAAEGDGDGADAGTGAGLFVALVQGESVVDVARLVFRGGEPSDADGGQDSYSSNPSSSDDTAVSASTTDGVLQEVNSKYTDELLGNLSFGGGGLLVSSQDDQWINQSNWEGEGKEEEWEGDYEGYLSDEMRGSSDLLISASEQPASSFWSSRNNDDSSSDDGQHDQDQEDPKNCDEHWSNTSLSHLSASLFWSEKDDSSNGEQDQEHDNETDNKAHQSIQISLRLWPAQEHAVIKIFRGGNWVLTKDYILSWMKPEDVRTEYNLQVEFGGSFANVLGFRNNDCTMDFEVRMDCTPMLKNLVKLLKPSICNFQIIKKVGRMPVRYSSACLFMGSKCALKSLTQKYPCTSEPREVEIISNLKDTNVMIFYQAWIEPWAYKGQAKQDYLFIHLEFCQSTVKHALLYKNRHWFPNKWFLFEEIVRIVHKLHDAYVVHRDLKPDNIFLNSELVVRVGDFGDACIGRDELGLYGGGTPKLGTQYYFAPELNSGGKITEKVDIYSMGVILFEIFAMFGTGVERIHIFPNLREQGPPDSWDGDRQLYDMMTAFEPSDRPSAAQVLDYIRLHHLE